MNYIEDTPAPLMLTSPELERLFLGRSVAAGYFMSRFRKVKRGISVLMEGRRENGQIVLAQDIAFHDGTRDRKTWRFKPLGERIFEGTREDVSGTAIVFPDGATMRRDFSGVLAVGAFRGLRVRIREVIALQSDGTLTIHGVATKWGIRLGMMSMRLAARQPAGAQPALAA